MAESNFTLLLKRIKYDVSHNITDVWKFVITTFFIVVVLLIIAL